MATGYTLATAYTAILRTFQELRDSRDAFPGTAGVLGEKVEIWVNTEIHGKPSDPALHSESGSDGMTL